MQDSSNATTLRKHEITGNRAMEATVSIITPTTGSEFLGECMRSVALQTYPHISHVVVVDGEERRVAAEPILALHKHDRLKSVVLPCITGAGGFQGHRIYGALPFLLNTDYVCYLDEDNWLDDNHVESLVSLATAKNLDWAYSLRKIVRQSGEFVCNDDCNSLGRWPSYDGAYHHVDTSCYMLRREVACRAANAWNRSDLDGTAAADRMLCKELLASSPLFHTTGMYTVNYRLASRQSEAGGIRFYTTGNSVHKYLYRNYPWRIFGIRGKCSYQPHLEYEWAKIHEENIGVPMYDP